MTSTIKVNKIEKESGSTLTLGGPSTAVTLACGATQTGFGRTGTVDWCTTAKTSPLTVASGNGYFINTTGGAITVTLPSSPSAGDIVAFKDYANTWDTNNVTVGRGGSKINGVCECATLDTESQSVTLIYVDGTKGWQDIHDSTSNVTGAAFVAATGGTVTTSGNFKIHTFTSDGCFQVTSAGAASGSNKISYMVVAGGGAGGDDRSGGGGAGGFREGKCSSDPYTASPLAATPCSALTASVATFPITVGGGGAAIPGPAPANSPVGSGTNSVFSTITSTGGGGGGSGPGPYSPGQNGGSGGGSDAYGNPSAAPNMAAGSGNTPPVSPPQGNNGGVGIYNSPNGSGRGGGGGGATVAGTGGTPGGNPGGAGATTSINATPTAYAGGGGGSTCGPGGVTGGAGGGGKGGCSSADSVGGTPNTGGGGGGGNGGTAPNGTLGGAGGSGIVILRYKFQ